MRAHGLPLWALESHDAVRDFDLVAFTLGYEMCYSNVLNMLELAQIPLLSKDRRGLENIVFAGGVCAVNPEPLADFIDFFSVGEGEESTPEIIECYRAAKKQGLTKLEFLHEVFEILVEDKNEKFENTYCGRTDGGRLVNFKSPTDIVGQFVDVKIKTSRSATLWGDLITEEK